MYIRKYLVMAGIITASLFSINAFAHGGHHQHRHHHSKKYHHKHHYKHYHKKHHRHHHLHGNHTR